MKKTVVLLLVLGFVGFPGLLLARDYLVEGVDSRSSMEICTHPTPEQEILISALFRATDVEVPIDSIDSKAACMLVFERRQTVRFLLLSVKHIYDLSPLKDWVHLEALYLARSEVEDLRPLVSLVNLRELNLRDNDVKSLEPLRRLTKLEILNVGFNEVRDLSPLKNLKALRDLDVEFNHITDLSVIRGLPKLHIVNHLFNPVTDLSPLEGRNLKVRGWHENILYRELGGK